MMEMAFDYSTITAATDKFNGLEFVFNKFGRKTGRILSAYYNSSVGKLYFDVEYEYGCVDTRTKTRVSVAFDDGRLKNGQFKRSDLLDEQERLAEMYGKQAEEYAIKQKQLEEENNKRETERKRLIEENNKREAEEKRWIEIINNKKLIGTSWNKVYCIYNYYPPKYKFIFPEGTEEFIVSEKILGYKDANDMEIVYSFTEDFYREISSILKNHDDMNRVVIVPVPRSHAETVPATQYTTEKLVQLFSGRNDFPQKYFINGCGILTRKYDIQSAHNSNPYNRPTYKMHIESMKCHLEEPYVEGTLYILLDDIYTFGEQMKACRLCLANEGVPLDNICAIALGKDSLAKNLAKEKGIEWISTYY